LLIVPALRQVGRNLRRGQVLVARAHDLLIDRDQAGISADQVIGERMGGRVPAHAFRIDTAPLPVFDRRELVARPDGGDALPASPILTPWRQAAAPSRPSISNAPLNCSSRAPGSRALKVTGWPA